MLKVKKKHGKIVQAYRLGEANDVLEKLIAEGKIVDRKDGSFEVFSQEAVKSGSGHGQLAVVGDWIRIDGAGFPYPNKDEWFRKNMKHASGDDYEQLPKELNAWTADMGMCPEVEYLIREKGLTPDEDSPDRYFSAILWGAKEVADRNAVLIFYAISYGEDGSVKDADYNFVERKEFERTYDVL